MCVQVPIHGCTCFLYNLDCCFIAFSGVRSPFCNDDAVQSSGGPGGLRLTRGKQCGCCIWPVASCGVDCYAFVDSRSATIKSTTATLVLTLKCGFGWIRMAESRLTFGRSIVGPPDLLWWWLCKGRVQGDIWQAPSNGNYPDCGRQAPSYGNASRFAFWTGEHMHTNTHAYIYIYIYIYMYIYMYKCASARSLHAGAHAHVMAASKWPCMHACKHADTLQTHLLPQHERVEGTLALVPVAWS